MIGHFIRLGKGLAHAQAVFQCPAARLGREQLSSRASILAQQRHQLGLRGFAAAAGPSDYYELLGVSRGASDDEIKKAYRREALKWHPDRHQEATRAEAEKRFKLISEAYQALSSSSGRSSYDSKSSSSGQEWASSQRQQQSYGWQQPRGGQQPQGGFSKEWGYNRHMSRDEADRLFREVFQNMGGAFGSRIHVGPFSPKDFEAFEQMLSQALRGAARGPVGASREEVVQEVVTRPGGLRVLRTTRTAISPIGTRIVTVQERILGPDEVPRTESYTQQGPFRSAVGEQPQSKSLVRDLFAGFLASAASVAVPMILGTLVRAVEAIGRAIIRRILGGR